MELVNDEETGEEVAVFYNGKTSIDSVEIVYGGQANTRKAAIRFEKALTHSHEVINSVVRGGPGIGINADTSINMYFENNIVWDQIQFGVIFQSVVATQYHKNFVGHIVPRPELEGVGMSALDIQGGVCLCSLNYPKPCPGLSITNNIVGGSVFVGFIAPAHDCNDDGQRVFRDNVAHSISGGANGSGAVVYADTSKPEH